MASKRRGHKVSVLVVPEKEGAVFSFKLPLLAFRLGLVVAALAVVFFLIMGVSWTKLLKKATIYDRLADENAVLLQEHNRIAELQNRVERLQQLEDQIRRVLGANASSDTASRIFSSPTTNEPYAQAPERGEPWPAPREEASGLPSAIYPLQDPGILRQPEIPSLWPVQGFMSRGYEVDEVVPGRSHTGVDIAAQEGTIVRATAGGVVIWSGWSPLYGNLLVLAHSSEYFSVYGHNQLNLVKPRDRVERGDPIALLGNTGQSSAPHLHFEIWRGAEPINPADLLAPF